MHSKNMVISDFCITDDPTPQVVADKILEYHLRPLEKASEYLGFSLAISKKSSYRPEWYEIMKKRKGVSEHTFRAGSKGASDITTLKIRQKQIELSKGLISYDEYIEFARKEFAEKKDEILDALIKKTEYTRIAQYETFFHGDFKLKNERWVYSSKWIRQYKV